MNADGDQEEGENAEKDNSMNDHGGAAGPHAAELHHPVVTRQLEQ